MLNNLDIGINDLIVGVIYGNRSELSSHYKKIDEKYPVVIGIDFWHHLTGKDDFYFDLIDVVGEVALEVDGTKIIQETIETLSRDIEARFF